MAERPSADYNCKQLELYAVCRLGLGSYREYLAEFGNFKGKYDEGWGNDFETAINDAAKLPDFQARDEKSETAGIKLAKKGTECANKWQDLKRYIADVNDWADLQKPKLEAAGSTLYRQASQGNWEVMKGLLQTAKNFIDNNETELEADGNMPNSFKGQFDTLKQDFEAIYDVFTDAEQDQSEETDEKIDENNALYKTLIDMFLDGQAIFREKQATKERFIFDHVLSIVRGSQGKTKTVAVAAASHESVDRVVKNSKIVNTGTVTLWVAEGNVETQPQGAVQVEPESDIPVPNNNKVITIFNNDTETAGECTVRVTVD